MQFEEQIQGITLVLQTNEEIFSPAAIDKGTRAMLSFVSFSDRMQKRMVWKLLSSGKAMD